MTQSKIKFCKKCQCKTERYPRGDCKPCDTARTAAHYAANCESRVAKSRAHYAANREKIAATQAAYRAANRESIAARQAAYQKASPEVRRIQSANRRALKKSAGGKLSKGLSTKLFELQRGKCACCGLELGKKFHLDHIMPLALGGQNTDSNMQLLRAVCNLQKGAKNPIEFMQKKGKLL